MCLTLVVFFGGHIMCAYDELHVDAFRLLHRKEPLPKTNSWQFAFIFAMSDSYHMNYTFILSSLIPHGTERQKYQHTIA